MLGRNPGFVTSQGMILADLFAAEEDCEITSISSKVNKIARLAEIVETLIKKHRNFDIVIVEVYSGLSFIIAETVSFLCGVFKLPLVMVLHGGSLPEFTEKHPRRVKKTLRRADFLVAPSGFLAEKIGRYGFEVRLIPNVIKLEDYPYRERAAIAPRLVWMRSFHALYNPQMAIEVFARVRQSFPAATLMMAGADKGLEAETKKAAADLGFTEAEVYFAGFLDGARKIAELARGEIYLHTNVTDNMPVSVVEACALGLPVVATRVGGLPYLLTNGENGILVESKNVEMMSAAVKTLLENPALTGKISRNARRLAERSAWNSVKRDWENLFDEIYARKFHAQTAKIADKNLKVEKGIAR